MSIEISTLPSGLTIVTDPMPNVESISVSLTVAAGSRCETESEHGIAHFLEHMAFKGTRKRSARDIAEAVENVGGDINAATSVENTAYTLRCLAADLPLAIDVISDILTNSVFDPEEIAREKSVVLQEIAAVDDTPDDIVFDRFSSAAFPRQAIGRPILGTDTTVQSFDRDMIRAFLAREYRAQRMVLAIAGKVKHESVVKFAGDMFGDFGGGNAPARAPARYGGGEARENRRLEQAHVVLGFQAPSFHDPDYYAAQIFTNVAGGGMSSRLFQEIREKRGLAYAIYAFQWGYADVGIFGVYAGASNSALGDLLPLMIDTMQTAAETASEAELERAKAQLRAGLLMALESSSARADYAARHMLAHGRVIPPHEIVAKIDALDLRSVRAAGLWLLSSAPTLSAIGPLKGLMSTRELAKRLPAAMPAA
jgi:predicted Zn-dependent peptidase